MSNTGAYDPSLEDLIRGPLPQLWQVLVYDAAGSQIPLQVQSCSLTFDEAWWPYVQGSVTARISDDQATLDRLDPRQKVRVEVQAGYRLPDNSKDIHLLAQCWLVSRSVDRPANLLELSIQGGEYIAGRVVEFLNVVAIPNKAAWSSTTAARAAVNDCLTAAGQVASSADWDYAAASQETGWSGDGTDRYGVQLPAQGASPLDVAADIAARVGAWLYCDGAGVWHMPVKPSTASAVTAHQLKVGNNGTVIDSATVLERGDDWGNAVLEEITYANASGAEVKVWGRARLASGPFAVATIGAVVVKVDRAIRTYVSQARADQMAGALLGSVLTLGRSLSLDAVAAYWLRPTQTVTVQLPLGGQERVLVSAVRFNLDDGSMAIRTRLPENVSGITIGG